MSKTVKNSLIVIGIVIVLFVMIWFIYDMIKTEPVDANVENTNLVDENTGLDNLINELFDDTITNKLNENVVDNSDTDNEEDIKNEEKNDTDVSTSENMTSKQEKAIALVKKAWGGEDGVYFSNESIDSQGRYIVSVRDKGTTNSLAFFLVDVEKELVTKQ